MSAARKLNSALEVDTLEIEIICSYDGAQQEETKCDLCDISIAIRKKHFQNSIPMERLI